MNRKAEQEWLEQVRLDNLRKAEKRRYGKSPIEALLDDLDRTEALEANLAGWPFPGPPPCPAVGGYVQDAYRQRIESMGLAAAIVRGPIDGAYGSTWNDSPRVRARVFPCTRCQNPARGYEPLCAYCADWNTVDEAVVGPDVIGPWPAVVGITLGLLSLASIAVLWAGWVS